jgi:hypothetical protein
LGSTAPESPSYYLSGIVRANQNFVNNTNFFSMGMAAAHPGNSTSPVPTGLHLGMLRDGSGSLRLAAFGGDDTFDLGAAALDTNYMIVVGLTANAGGGDTLDAWIAPDGGSLTQVLTGQTLETFAGAEDVSRLVLQQHNDSNDEQVTRAWADEMRFGTSFDDVVTGPGPAVLLEVESSGSDLTFTWDSRNGMLYNLRSETDPSMAAPLDWPLFDGQQDLEATPPKNTLTIALPVDSERFFVIEEFNAPPVELLNEDFEGGASGWTWGSDLDPGTDWQLGLPTNGPAAAHSGSNCYGTNLDADYASDADIWLRSPEIDLTTAGGATLKFWHWYDTEQIIDLCTLSVVDSVTNNPIAVLDTYDFFNADWEEVTKVLPAAALGSKVKIEFRLTSDDAVFWPGWFVDDVLVTVP